MVSYNVILNSLNRVQSIDDINNCFYSFDWTIFEDGEYEIKLSYIGALTTINGYYNFFCSGINIIVNDI